MKLEDAERVLELFPEVCACAPEQRADFLTRACAGNDAVRAEIESLLRAEAPAPDFLAQPVFGRGLEVLGETATDGELKAGDTLGDYRVVSLLGVGGMGEVYLAADTALGRQVALKLIQRGQGSTLLNHFRHERRVLAGLNHPNIARLYGGAVTAEGRAYLVMEYVEGERLDEYCNARRQSVSERLVLFRKVCSAVAYAHQNLVIHRDLKPANIRVTAEGEPKLLDFGIAKLLEAETMLPGAEPTLTMQAMMTPEYASPEQLRGQAITTASDVYSLGVLLYELLCGQRPYCFKSRRLEEVVRAVCEQDPERPSTAARRANGTEDGGRFDVLPDKLRRRLEGDLDNIVAKAMHKEPARRYGSVAQLSEDIRRHCTGLPVNARRDTLSYRAGKFVRRNKTGVAAAAFVLLALVGGLMAATWQAHVARQALDRAQLAQKQSERLNAFLQTLLGSADPENGSDRDLKVVQVLDQASGNLDQELAGEPALLAQAHQTIGQAYATLQVVEPALHHLRAALEIDRRIYGDENIVTARAKAALGASLRALTRRYTEAEPLLRQALAVERRQPPAEQRKLPWILDNEGRILSQLDRVGEAKTMVAEYLSLTRQASGEQNTAYASGLLQLANLSMSQEDYAGAESPTRQAVAILRRLRPQAPSFAGVLTGLAYVLILEGKLDEPEGLLQEAREIYRRTTGEQGIPAALTIGCLAWLHFLDGDYPRAEVEMRASQALVESSMITKADQDYVAGRVLLALAMTRDGKAAEAEPILRENLELAKANHLRGNALPDNVSAAIGECLLAQKRYAEAEPLLLDSYHHPRPCHYERESVVVVAARQLSELYTAWNKPEEARRFAVQAASPNGPAR